MIFATTVPRILKIKPYLSTFKSLDKDYILIYSHYKDGWKEKTAEKAETLKRNLGTKSHSSN